MQQNFSATVSICNFTAAKITILNRKILKFEFDLDFVLVALTAPVKDYRICYLINKFLQFNFSREPDLTVETGPDSAPSLFAMFRYKPAETGPDFYFIANKGSGGYLVPEMRKTDYFLMIKNYIDDNELELLLGALNRIPEVVAAVKIDPKKIKSRENLLF